MTCCVVGPRILGKKMLHFLTYFMKSGPATTRTVNPRGGNCFFAAHSQVTKSQRWCAVLGHIFSCLVLCRSSKLGFEVLIHRGLIDSFCLIFWGLALGISL